ncbi:MAG TPA: ATP-binding protein, partial [Polyangiaceae bacterium]
ERASLLASEKQSRIEAERANGAKDLFLATLSHELRTPLSTMLLSAQLLQKMAQNDGKWERPSAAIERAVLAQSKLIDDLLDVSRVVSGKLLLDFGPVDIKTAVENAIEIASAKARATSVHLEFVAAEGIGTVYGDPLRLQQIVGNLLDNALKFTGHGGHVTVRLSRVDHSAVLSVSDTGIGIPGEMLPYLFDRFVQGDSSVTRAHGGLGLGLSIVRHLVTMHGGEVRAESPGAKLGSTFYVTLPLVTSDGPRGEVTQKESARGIAGVRILLVEDDDDSREACAAMLEALGAKVCSSSSAAAGLVAIGDFRPQVILSDIAMPGEDGLRFMRSVRQLSHEEGGDTPAAALSALAGDEDRQRALEAGFDLHLAKPIGSTRLVLAITDLVDVERSSTD